MALANMLSELRKYRVGFTIAHQYMIQLAPDIRHAVLGNAGTIICFRVGAEDAPISPVSSSVNSTRPTWSSFPITRST